MNEVQLSSRCVKTVCYWRSTLVSNIKSFARFLLVGVGCYNLIFVIGGSMPPAPILIAYLAFVVVESFVLSVKAVREKEMGDD